MKYDIDYNTSPRVPAPDYDDPREHTLKDYEIHISAGDTCPTCGAPLHLLVDMESATVDGERCPVDWDHIDNLFLDNISWPNTQPREV